MRPIEGSVTIVLEVVEVSHLAAQGSEMGFRVPGCVRILGSWVQSFGFWLRVLGFGTQAFIRGSRVQGSRVPGFQGSGFQGSGFRPRFGLTIVVPYFILGLSPL